MAISVFLIHFHWFCVAPSDREIVQKYEVSNVWRITTVNYSVVSNHLETMSGHVEGVPQPQVLGTRTNMSWDDPPSRAQLGGAWNWRNPERGGADGWK